ncbi:threonine/serine exporter family protein [Holzapfeliella sp. He02]|uniref:Threonine/serine exporter family protein n=1 Tax=Holzapfeliella saturejae TaxID=3082953 RepID=A0ABU8SED2_9LACO
MNKRYVDIVLNTCLMAGKIMIQSGSEMYRVEDTINHIAKNAGLKDPVVFSTPTGLFVGVNHHPIVQLTQVYVRTINLEKVHRVNRLSREFGARKITLNELHKGLHDIHENTPSFSHYLKVLSTALLSAVLMVLAVGQFNLSEFCLVPFAGMLAYLTNDLVNRYTNIKFLSQVVASMIVALFAVIMVRLSLAQNMDAMIVGGILPLVPGLAIMNSLRDLFAGHLLTGVARGMEALITAAAIGGGVATVLRFFGGIGTLSTSLYLTMPQQVLINIVFSFLGTVGFAIVVDVPAKALPYCGFSGMLGWMVYWIGSNSGSGHLMAYLLGAFAVGILSIVFARTKKMPVIIFNIPAIVPLVPGVTAYQAVRQIVTGGIDEAMRLSFTVLMITGAIAVGFMLSQVCGQLTSHIQHNYYEKKYRL